MVYNSAFFCTFIYWTKQSSNTDAEVFPLYSWYRVLAHSASSSLTGRPENWQQDRHLPQAHPRSFQHGQWPQQDREPEIQQWEHKPVISKYHSHQKWLLKYFFSLHTGSFSTNVAKKAENKAISLCKTRYKPHVNEIYGNVTSTTVHASVAFARHFQTPFHWELCKNPM